MKKIPVHAIALVKDKLYCKYKQHGYILKVSKPEKFKDKKFPCIVKINPEFDVKDIDFMKDMPPRYKMRLRAMFKVI